MIFCKDIFINIYELAFSFLFDCFKQQQQQQKNELRFSYVFGTN